MSVRVRRWLLGSALLASAAALPAQRVAEIAFVYPAGLQRGTSVEVEVGGKDLQAVTGAHFGHPGVRAEVIDHYRPMSGRERLLAQDRLEELRDKQKAGKLTEEEIAEGKDLREKLARARKSRDLSPQLVERVYLKVTATADAAPGTTDLRLVSPNGLSNPLRFVVSGLPEKLEADVEVKDEEQQSSRVELPCVVNGQVLERDVDRFRFRAKSGTRLVAVAEARSLIPFVADAVPGWFQACLTLRDADGKVLRAVDDRGPDPDPVLYWVVDRAGVYELEIGDAVCRGREDFVYRLTIGELPHVSSVFPLGAHAGTRVRAMLRGVNLEAVTKEVDLTGKEPGVVPVETDQADIDPPRIEVDDSKCEEVREVEPNGVEPQQVKTPVLVDGIIDQPGDVDVYSFSAPGGSRLVAEITARRLGSPLDSLLRLVGPDGKEIARCDDDPDLASGLDTQAADSRLEFAIRRGGMHQLLVSDVQNKGSGDHVYRLYLGPRRPDFAARITPSTVTIGPGGTAVFTAHVSRHGGFDGPVELALADAPAGFRLGGAVVPEGCEKIQVTVTGAGSLNPGDIVPLAFTATARVKNRTLERRVEPCDDRMQAFIYRHLVPAEQFLCACRRGARVELPEPQLGRKPLQLKLGQVAKLVVEQPAGKPARRQFQFVLRDPPEGIELEKVEAKTTSFVLRIAVDRSKELRGLSGNLIVDVQWKGAAGKGGKTRTSIVDTLPAIPFEIAN